MPATRYRCTACGNLTRFDVTTTRQTQGFHHYTVGGDLEVEDEQVLSESVDAVVCRWCGPSGQVVIVDETDDAATATDSPASSVAEG